MTEHRLNILNLSTATSVLLLFSLCSAIRPINISSANYKICDSVIVNNDFSQKPLGKSKFSKSYLIDTLFSNLKREECVIYDKGSIETYSITFYSGKESCFTFYKQYQRDEYFLHSFDLQDATVQLSLNKENKYGIGFTKDFLSKALLFSNNLCDKVFITNEERNVDVIIYFQNNKVSRINYLTYL